MLYFNINNKKTRSILQKNTNRSILLKIPQTSLNVTKKYQNISKHLKIYQNISKIYQNISIYIYIYICIYIYIYQNISKYFEIY